MHLYSADELVTFEEEIAVLFDQGKIRHPVHLTYGNEEPLIGIFKKIQQSDWVFCSWRSHYHALLKGVERTKLVTHIVNGQSIALCFPDQRFYSSAIVGGQISIAVGVAKGIKLSQSNEHVWCFIGDMTSQTGVARVAIEYSANFELPITFIVEDNNNSVCTDTRKIWNTSQLAYEKFESPNVIHYNYKSKYPHAGAGKRVQF
jgi:pyruvate dehydrogenase E1 component alpha subunit